MKAIVKINKVGISIFAIQMELNKEIVWGKFIGDGKVSAEQQHNYAKTIFTANTDAEIEYIPNGEGKKGIKISSIKEIKDGKVVVPTKEQITTPKTDKVAESTKVKEICTPEAVQIAQKQAYKPPFCLNKTQISIERQVAAKVAGDAIQILAGHLDTAEKVVDAFNKMFCAAINKIQG